MSANTRHYCVRCRSKQYEKYMYEVYVNNLCKAYWICDMCYKKYPPRVWLNRIPTQTYNSSTGQFITVPGVSTEGDN